MVLDKQVPTSSDKQTFKGQANKKNLNAASSTAKFSFLTCLKKYTKVFKSTHSGIIPGEGVKAIKNYGSHPTDKLVE
jgi:hypothetical protein